MFDMPSPRDHQTQADQECREFLELMRWSDGVICPTCGAYDPYVIRRHKESKNFVPSFFKCRICRRQFTVTVGTIFEGAHRLETWLDVIRLMAQGWSDHKLIAYELWIERRTALSIIERVRTAPADDPLVAKLLEHYADDA